MSSRGLSGVKVVELGSAIAGPLCGALLGDMGADVIKVEIPGRGDDSRNWGEKVKGESAYFLNYNRNKRSVVLDLKSRKGREILVRLVRRCDVLIENFRPGTMEKLSLSYDHLRRINPKLIYCAVSGFGQTGPYRQLGGYDAIIQAMSGVMSVNGEEDGPPLRVGFPITDIIAALYAAFSVMVAFHVRERTRRGQRIDVSLFESGVFALSQWLVIHALTGKRIKRFGNRYPLLAPYEPFQASDALVAVAIGNDELWARLCRIIGMEELINDPRFKTNLDRIRPENRQVLTKILEGIFKTKTAGEWLREMWALGIPAGAVNSIEDLVHDKQLKTRKAFVTVAHPVLGRVKLYAGIPKFSETPGGVRIPPPTLGQHTIQVLRELGYSKREISALKTQSVIS